MTSTVHASRRIERLVAGRATADGAGVKLTRVLASELQRRLDPFLMLDAFANENPDDYIAGFPPHPHRGFETVTYMLAGRMRHRDSAGNEGLLEPGGMQWMCAGRGVIHSEMPEQEDGLMEGFQLWLNLPARSKMQPAWYRDIPAAAIPDYALPGGGRVRVLAGASQGITGAITRPDTEPLYLDVWLDAGMTFAQALPVAHNAFVYVYRGEVQIAGTPVPSRQMAVLDNAAHADGVSLLAGAEGARLLLLAGQPLGEPIAQYGPFVMNTEAELHQAIQDYRGGVLA
ncbi:pirin family protein [Chitinilyticum litopenaei]|uniref:pirin family protein n=1 Tax=Chitinilyticum litopenaei TaxID=1121276 RepID=UPI0006888048|nr:pirin family protein [Chitinilyticum litopenaei]